MMHPAHVSNREGPGFVSLPPTHAHPQSPAAVVGSLQGGYVSTDRKTSSSSPFSPVGSDSLPAQRQAVPQSSGSKPSTSGRPLYSMAQVTDSSTWLRASAVPSHPIPVGSTSSPSTAGFEGTPSPAPRISLSGYPPARGGTQYLSPDFQAPPRFSSDSHPYSSHVGVSSQGYGVEDGRSGLLPPSEPVSPASSQAHQQHEGHMRAPVWLAHTGQDGVGVTANSAPPSGNSHFPSQTSFYQSPGC